MKNVLLLVVMLVVASGLAGCVATQDFVREEVSTEVRASETRLRSEIVAAEKRVDEKAARNIEALGGVLKKDISRLDNQYASLKGELAGLGGRVGGIEGRLTKAEDGQKAASAAMGIVRKDVAAVGHKAEAAGTKAEAVGQRAEAVAKRAEVAVERAGEARKEAGIAQVMHRYGGTHAALVYGFGYAKAEVTRGMWKGIEEKIVERVLNKNLEAKALIGYADTRGKADKNDELAKKRVEAVKAAILAYEGMDLSSAKLEVEGASDDFGALGYNRSVLVLLGPKSSAQAPAASSAAPAPAASAPPAPPAPAAPSGTPAAPPQIP